jgi:hypothetical protein
MLRARRFARLTPTWCASACCAWRAQADVEHELAEHDRLAAKVNALGLVPEVEGERAALRQREGRVEGARRELTRARDLYREMGAGPNADHIAAQMEAMPQ